MAHAFNSPSLSHAADFVNPPSSRRSTRLRVETVSTVASLVGLAPEWRALEDRAMNTLPFRTAEWTLAWWEHLRRNRSGMRDSLRVYTLRTEQGELVGVAPMMLTETPAVGLVRARCLQFIGADPNITELRGPLFEPASSDACFRGLQAAVSEGSDWDWLIWSGIPGEGGSSRALGIDAPHDTPYYVLPLEGDFPRFKAALPRNMKESLRKCFNSLRRDGLSHQFEVSKSRGEMEGALADFFRLHSRRAAERSAVRHPDLFASSASRAFLTDLCGRFADRGGLRIFRLRVNGHVVSARVGFVVGGSLYLYYSGYDPAFAKYSVMTTTVHEAIRHAFGEGLRSVNLSSGNDISKTRWRPIEKTESGGTVESQWTRGKVAHRAYRTIAQLLHSAALRERAPGIAARLLSRE